MGIDEQFEEFKRMLLCIQRELNDARAEIRSLRFGDRISFSLHEASEVTGISYENLHKRCKLGQLPYSQTEKGAAIIIARTDLEAFLEKYRIGSEPEAEGYELKLSHAAKREVSTKLFIR